VEKAVPWYSFNVQAIASRMDSSCNREVPFPCTEKWAPVFDDFAQVSPIGAAVEEFKE
jgi:hypothetical protein